MRPRVHDGVNGEAYRKSITILPLTLLNVKTQEITDEISESEITPVS